MDLALLLKTVIIGLVEGITEFLPISSTGHIILAEQLLHFHHPLEAFCGGSVFLPFHQFQSPMHIGNHAVISQRFFF